MKNRREASGPSTAGNFGARIVVTAVAILTVMVLSTAGIASARNTPTTLIGVASIDPGQSPDAIDPTPVRAMVEANGRYYVGGLFSEVGGESQSFLAAIEVATGQLDPDFRPVIGGGGETEVMSIALSPDGDDLYVGGIFSSVNGSTRNNIAKIDAITGAVDGSFNPAASAAVESIVVDNQGVYAGGRFFRIGGTISENLAKLDPTTGLLDPAWTATTDGTVFDLELVGNSLYVGGNFDTAVDEPHQNIVRLDNVTGAVHPNWNNAEGTPQRVQSMAVSNDGQTIFLGTGGRSGLRGNTAFAMSSTGTLLWHRVADGDIQAMEFVGDTLYLGTHGQFIFIEPRELLDGSVNPDFPENGYANGADNPNAIRREKLFALNPANGELLDWDPQANSVNGVWEMDSGPSGLLVGGDFTQILNPTGVTGSGGAVQSPHFAVFSGIGGGDTAPEPLFSFDCDGTSCSFDASASFDDGPITYRWDFGNGQSAVGVAPTATLANNTTHEVTLEVVDNAGVSVRRTQLVAVGDGGTDITVLDTAAVSDTNNTFAVELPADVADGDVAVAFVSVNTATTVATAPDGWVAAGDELNGNLRTFIFWAPLADADGGETVAFDLSEVTKSDVTVATLRGVDAVDPIAAIGSNVTSQIGFQHVAPSLSFAGDATVLQYWAERTSAGTELFASPDLVTLSTSIGSLNARVNSVLALDPSGSSAESVVITEHANLRVIGWSIALRAGDPVVPEPEPVDPEPEPVDPEPEPVDPEPEPVDPEPEPVDPEPEPVDPEPGDITPPVATFENPTAATVGPNDLSGTVVDGASSVERVQVVVQNIGTREYWNGESWQPTWEWNTAELAGDAWTLPDVNLAPSGRYSVLLWAWDSVGNRSNWEANDQGEIRVSQPDQGAPDTTPPTVALTSATYEIVGFVDLRGTATDDGSGVERVNVVVQNLRTEEYWNGTEWVVTWAWNETELAADGTWALEDVLLDQVGNYEVLFWAWDFEGNRSNWMDNPQVLVSANLS